MGYHTPSEFEHMYPRRAA
ncbi:hypothetical protein [Paenibacillus lactis]